MKKSLDDNRSAFLFACVEGSNDAIMLTESDGTIFYVNPAWERIFGYSGIEVIGRTPRILRSGLHGPDFYSALWKDVLHPEKGYWKGEIINRTKEGREIPVLLTISPHRTSEGVLQGYMSIAVDVSEKKKLEAQGQWQDRLATIGLLASGLAHELGTPLGVVRGRAEYLLNSNSSKESSDKASLQTIISQVDRISALMQSLLSLSKLSPSEVRMPVSLEETTAHSINLLGGKLESASIVLHTNLSPQARVLAEPGRLEYIILNLCLNSIQAIENQKEESKLQNHSLSIETHDRKNAWEIAIADTGGGIPPENFPHLFKPFFTTKEIGVGTGLSLSMIYQIVHSWNGKIELDNVPGVGATFRITLPKA